MRVLANTSQALGDLCFLAVQDTAGAGLSAST